MKNLLIFLTILLTSTSCLTNRRIARNCDRFLEVCGTETKTWVEYRDTVVQLEPMPVKLPESNIAVDLILVSGSKVTLAKQVFKRGLITVSVEVIDNRLLVDASIPDSLLVQPDPVRLPGAIVEKKVEVVVPQKYIPKAYRWAFWIVAAQLAVALFFAAKTFTPSAVWSKIFSIFAKRNA